jgi:hypothetical protein
MVVVVAAWRSGGGGGGLEVVVEAALAASGRWGLALIFYSFSKFFAERRVTFGKPFAKSKPAFAECIGHSANHGFPVVPFYLVRSGPHTALGQVLTVNFGHPRVLVIHWFRL